MFTCFLLCIGGEIDCYGCALVSFCFDLQALQVALLARCADP